VKNEGTDTHRAAARLNLLVCIVWLLVGCSRSAITPAPVITVEPTETVPPLATRTPTLAPTATTTATSLPPTDLPPTDLPPTETVTPLPIETPLEPVATLPPAGLQQAYSSTLTVMNANGATRTVTVNYLLYVPREYGVDPSRSWPLIVFLHGSGERGYDAALVADTGLPELLLTDPDFPAMVLSPQVPTDETWNTYLRETKAVLDDVQARYAVDAERVYLTGLSMGGFGAWALALTYPQQFAALVPIAGGWDSENDSVPRSICNLKTMPIWVFHGALDTIVLPKKSELMVNALLACGSAVQFTLYPDADHRESWANAYADPKLYEWLFQQVRP
jgi:dienelactone hydrolase